MARRWRGRVVLDSSNNNPVDAGLLLFSRAAGLVAKASEGTGFVDRTFASQRAAASKCRVPFGSYCFLRMNQDAAAEVRLYLKVATPRIGDLQPVLDAEVSDGEPMSIVAARVNQAVRELELNGYRPILYMPVSMVRQVVQIVPSLRRRVVVWEPQYPGRFTRWFPRLAKLRIRVGSGVTVGLWQFTDVFAVRGRSFDGSVLLMDINKLRIGGKKNV